MADKENLKELLANLPQQGRVEWISYRPRKRAPVEVVGKIDVLDTGLKGDHYAGSSGKRSITLIQYEHLAVIASLLHKKNIDPADLRRNLAISGINLLALKDKRFIIGTAILEMTGLCHPCSRMEQNLGPGGYNAMRGHGGINARVIKPGIIRLGDSVSVLHQDVHPQ